MDLKEPGNLLYQVGVTRDELGGSHFAQIEGTVPIFAGTAGTDRALVGRGRRKWDCPLGCRGQRRPGAAGRRGRGPAALRGRASGHRGRAWSAPATTSAKAAWPWPPPRWPSPADWGLRISLADVPLRRRPGPPPSCFSANRTPASCARSGRPTPRGSKRCSAASPMPASARSPATDPGDSRRHGRCRRGRPGHPEGSLAETAAMVTVLRSRKRQTSQI